MKTIDERKEFRDFWQLGTAVLLTPVIAFIIVNQLI
jgi:hypothetical protein